MESRLVRLEEIDDWEIYAKGLEAHVAFMHTQIGAWMDVDSSHNDKSNFERWRRGDLRNPDIALISRLNGEMNNILMQAGNRAKRHRDRELGLTDSTSGLADVQFEED